MELINQLSAIIFYSLFFSWIFFKIRNSILIRKLNCKEIYKEINKTSKAQKSSKYLFRTIIIIISIFITYLTIGFILGIIFLFMIFITLGGTMFVDTGADSTLYDNLINFINNYFSLFMYIGYLTDILIYIILIRAININILNYKKLNDKYILNNSNPSIKNTNNAESNKNPKAWFKQVKCLFNIQLFIKNLTNFYSSKGL